MALVEQRPAVVSIVAACGAVGLSRATLYRLRRPPAPTPVPSGPRAPSPRRLSDTERQRILDTLHEPEFADQPPAEVYATLLGRDVYVGSIRTMYRVLAEELATRLLRAGLHAVPDDGLAEHRGREVLALLGAAGAP